MSTHCVVPVPKPALSNSSSRTRLLRQYQDCQTRYVTEGVWLHNHSLLRKVANSMNGEDALPGDEAIRIVSKLARELMMNDLEIVGWSIYISRLCKSIRGEQTRNLLTFAGVASKYYFDDNIEIIQAHLEKTLPGFTNAYNEWFKTHTHFMHISPKELNDTFRTMTAADGPTTPKQLLDYNSLVEDILASTPQPATAEAEQTFPIVPIPVKPEPMKAKPVPPEDPELPEFTYQWSIGLSLEKLGSLSELWPELQRKSPTFATEARLGHD